MTPPTLVFGLWDRAGKPIGEQSSAEAVAGYAVLNPPPRFGNPPRTIRDPYILEQALAGFEAQKAVIECCELPSIWPLLVGKTIRSSYVYSDELTLEVDGHNLLWTSNENAFERLPKFELKQFLARGNVLITAYDHEGREIFLQLTSTGDCFSFIFLEKEQVTLTISPAAAEFVLNHT